MTTSKRIIEKIENEIEAYENMYHIQPNAIILPWWAYRTLKDELPTIKIANAKQTKICGLEIIVAEDIQQFQIFRKVEI